jgi:hypothetical protein
LFGVRSSSTLACRIAPCSAHHLRTYATGGAFRKALEERLKRASLAGQMDLNRLRRQVSFDRLLARLFRERVHAIVLKGPFALELRFHMAPSAVDIAI